MTDRLQSVSRNLRVVSLCTIVSRIFGLLRDQAMGTLFGAGPILDSFTVAFRLPNLARVLLGEGALTTAFLPVMVEELHQHGRESAARVTWAVFVTLASVLCGLVLIAELAIALLVGFVPLPEETRLLCHLTAILLPYVILICLAAQLGAVLNALGRFVWPALVPVVLNLVWLTALWWVIPRFWSDANSQIQGTALFVVLAGGLQLVFLVPAIWRNGFGYRSDWPQAFGAVSRIGRDMMPVVIGLSITQMNAVLDSFVAWGFSQPDGSSALMALPGRPAYPLPAGTATALYLGQRLYQFPLGVFGVALGTVLFPLFTQHAQRGDLPKLREDLALGMRLVLAIGLPASAGLMVIAHPLSRLFFEYGRFDADAARQTGDMILCYGSGVWAYCGLLILQRAFYAIGDRLTPMYIGLAAMILNLCLNVTLIWPLGGRGLAMSTSMVAGLQALATCLFLQRRTGRLNWNEIGWTAFRTLIAVALMSAVCLIVSNMIPSADGLTGRAIRLLVPLMVGGVVFGLAAWLLRLREVWQVLFSRSRPTQSGPPTGSDVGIQ